MMHWSRKYIGLKYEVGARGPEKVDCWGLLRLVYGEVFGIELPLYEGITVSSALVQCKTFLESKENWIPVDRPFDGAAVAMSQKDIFHHVGVWTESDGGKIIHCWKAHNVIADTVRGLKFKGFKKIIFYKHRQWPT